MPPKRAKTSKTTANSDYVEKTPPAKKRRTSKTTATMTTKSIKKPRGGHKGKLRLLPEMPLDILYDIFGFLEPLDILNLARTTHALRGVVMRHSASSIWKQAFRNDPDIPPCPEGMTLSIYAALLFSHYCQYCLKPGRHLSVWVHGIRVCPKCSPYQPSIPSSYNSFKDVARVHQDFPNGALRHHSQLLLATQIKMNINQPQNIYLHTDGLELNRQMSLLKDDDKALHAFLDKRKKLVDDKLQFHADCEHYMKLRNARIRQEIEDAKERRKETILQRLRDLGYSDEVQHLNDEDPAILSEHPSIKRCKDLTDRTWANMKPSLIELLDDVREENLIKRRKSLLRKRQNILIGILRTYVLSRPPEEIIPRAADVCNMDIVKTIIEDTPSDVEATTESFSDIADQLPRLCEEWRATKEKFLVSLLPPYLDLTLGPEHTPDTSRLELATTWFKCCDLECSGSEPISYPRVLAHECLTALRHGYRNREDDLSLLFLNLKSVPWNLDGNKVTFCRPAAVAAESVIRSSVDPDVDVNTVTASQMDVLDRWLECMHCRHRKTGRLVFRWKKAVLHEMQHTLSEKKAGSWMRLDDDEASIAQATEEAAYMAAHEDSSDYCCRRCREAMSFSSINLHIRYSHGVHLQGVPKEEDYYLHPDASIQPPFPVTIPYAPAEPDISENVDSAEYVSSDEELEYVDYEPEVIFVDDD